MGLAHLNVPGTFKRERSLLGQWLRFVRAAVRGRRGLAKMGTPTHRETAVRKILATILALAGVASATAQAATPACATGPFREFDFWVGEWDVRDADGKTAGANRITSEENGCVLIEHWKSIQGGHGQSYNYYDPATQKWNQLWIGLGILLHMEGSFADGSMKLEGALQYLTQNKTTTLRGTWTALPDGRVRQLFEESTDGGKTWALWFDGYYTRR